MNKVILKSYPKVNVRKPIMKGDVPAGDYVVRSSDKWNTILWGEGDNDHIIPTLVYLTASASGIIRKR